MRTHQIISPDKDQIKTMHVLRFLSITSNDKVDEERKLANTM
jgi:hypothetical protein